MEESKKNLNFSQQGISLYFALLIMAILLAMALGLSTLSFRQLKMSIEMGNSVVSLYAADTGIERELFEENPVGTTYSDYLDLNQNGSPDSNDAFYNISVIASTSPQCLATNYCIESVGIFKGTRRALRIRK
jgi:hypothetical protein